MWPIKFIKRIFTRFNRKSYFQEHPSTVRMLHIKCVNPNCTAPFGIFEFDDEAVGAAGPSGPSMPLAQRYVISCPYCGAKNMVWLKRPNSISSHMDVIIVKDEPQDFR